MRADFWQFVRMKSKKKLFEFLASWFGLDPASVEIGRRGISDETYGRVSMIYLWNIPAMWKVSREEMRDALVGAGFKVSRGWGDGSDGLEVQVSFFKGWHWDE